MNDYVHKPLLEEKIINNRITEEHCAIMYLYNDEILIKFFDKSDYPTKNWRKTGNAVFEYYREYENMNEKQILELKKIFQNENTLLIQNKEYERKGKKYTIRAKILNNDKKSIKTYVGESLLSILLCIISNKTISKEKE